MLLYKCVDASNHPSFTLTKFFFRGFISIILMQRFLLSFLMNWQVGMKEKPHESWEKTVFDFFSSHVLKGSADDESAPSPFSLKISSGLNEFTLIGNRHIVTIINAYGSPPSYTCILIPCNKCPHVFFLLCGCSLSWFWFHSLDEPQGILYCGLSCF